MLLIQVCCEGSSWNRLVDLNQLSNSLVRKITEAQKTLLKELNIDDSEFGEIENQGGKHTWPAMVDDEITVYVNGD